MMKKDLEKIEGNKGMQLAPYDMETFKIECKNLVKDLSHEPLKSDIKINKFADDARYIPIQIVEDKLNNHFMGLWQTRNFKYTVIVNELVGDLELGIFNPYLGQWLWRSGTGSVLIQQKAIWGTDKDGKRFKKPVEVLNVELKIANTLVKDMGHLKAECVKNAAKSLGRFFGGHLNRNEEDGQHNPLKEVELEQIMADLVEIDNIPDLQKYYQSLPKSNKTRRIEQLFKEHGKIIAPTA